MPFTDPKRWGELSRALVQQRAQQEHLYNKWFQVFSFRRNAGTWDIEELSDEIGEWHDERWRLDQGQTDTEAYINRATEILQECDMLLKAFRDWYYQVE